MSDNFFKYLSILANGIPNTLGLGILGILSAGVIAILLSCLLTYNRPCLHRAINVYITIFTGSPLLVQIFLIYYGPSQFESLNEYLPTLNHVISSPFFCAYLALALNSGAYTTQIFYGALKAVPAGMRDACAALGMNKIQTLKVIVPYALKRALSTYSNEVIFVIKGTALASTIPVMDIMGYSKELNGEYYEFTIFIAAGCYYLLINGLLSIIMRLIEKKALVFEN